MAQSDYFSKREPKLYLMEAKTNDIVAKRIVKIGMSVNTGTRLKQIQTGCPFPVEIIKTCQRTGCAGEAERFLHGALEEYRTNGEWFALSIDQMNTLFTFMDCFIDWPGEWDLVWRNCHWDCAPIAQHPPVTVKEAWERRANDATVAVLNMSLGERQYHWDKAFEAA